MSKDKELAQKIPLLVEYMEDNFSDVDGINKMTILKATASYYESLVTAEIMRAMIIKSIGVIQ